MIQVLTQDIIRQHIDRIEPVCVADLFALSEATLPGALTTDLDGWAARASREIMDLPDGQVRGDFLDELSEISPEQIPTRLREAVYALASVSQPVVAAKVEQLRETWTAVPPKSVVLPKGPTKAPVQTATRAPGAALAAAQAAKKPTATRAPRPVRTPAALVDPRRAEWVREDVVVRLSTREYAERGLKESILVGGVRHRSPYKDLTEEEVKAELRRLERERTLKHTGERWMLR